MKRSSDSLSSPSAEYDTDLANIGNDTGTLCRVQEVFSNLHPECTGLNPPVPSLDTTWAPAGALAAGCSGKLTSPVVAGTGDIFVGCSDEKVYGFTPSGGLFAGSPLSVGDGSTTVNGNVGGILDPPLVDAVNGFRCAVGVSTRPSALYGVGFDNSSHVMTSGPAANFVQATISFNTEFSPVTEYLSGSIDQIFTGALGPSFPNTFVYNLTTFAPGFLPNALLPLPSSNASGARPGEGVGASGIVVDKVSCASFQHLFLHSSPTVPNLNNAVKLTPSGLIWPLVIGKRSGRRWDDSSVRRCAGA